jgi:hypothetical protein
MNINLLASVALFSELYNTESYQNITDILAEFIKATVVSEAKWSTNPTEITSLLETVYGFKIPEAVVRSTIKNRLKTVVKIENGIFHFDANISADFDKIDKNYISLKESHNQILEQLYKFVQKDIVLLPNEKARIDDTFRKFLMENGVTDKYSDQISAFIIKHSKDPIFTKNLNLVREGLILYQGIRFSSDLNIFGVWNTDLTIFLGPEHLLNALGFNGSLFKELFDDFYRLVNEINNSNKNRGSDKRVYLRYFSETENEIKSLFHSAELIILGKTKLIAHRPAIKEILNNCKNPSDIVRKRTTFFQDLKQMGIALQNFNDSDLYKYKDYNVEDKNTIDLLKEESLARTGNFDEQACHEFLRIFTKVNYYRGGQSRDKFENIGHIYITNNNLALFLAHKSEVKFDGKDIPFAKDLDYITNKFWFKLRKGLDTNQDFPKSFDVVTKAQIVLASHLQNSVLSHFETLKEDVQLKRLSEESALEINHNLRERINKPEDINDENVDISLEFLTSNNIFEAYVLEKEKKDKLLLESQNRVKELERELENKDAVETERQRFMAQEERNLRKDAYCIAKWKSEKKVYFTYTAHFGGIIFLTFFPVFMGMFLKVFNNFTVSFQLWNAKIITFWFITISIYLFELIG